MSKVQTYNVNTNLVCKYKDKLYVADFYNPTYSTYRLRSLNYPEYSDPIWVTYDKIKFCNN